MKFWGGGAGGAGGRGDLRRAGGSAGAGDRRVAAGGDSAMGCTHCGIDYAGRASRIASTNSSQLQAVRISRLPKRANGNLGVIF